MTAESGFVLEGIGMSYGPNRVLSDISCTVKPGAGWGILGNSGSGKSTLLRLLAGLEIPDTGSIYLHGRLLCRAGQILIPPGNRKISMVFQDLALWPNLTVMENVLLGMVQAKGEQERAYKSLSICGIRELASKYPGELSGGEQQRLALARALATRPEFLFLDEPFNGLDIGIKRSIINKIKLLAEENSITIVLVSHDPFEVLSLCSRVLVLQHGGVVESGPLDRLILNPESDVLMAFRDYVNGLRDAWPSRPAQ